MQFTLTKSSKDGQMQEYVNLEKDKINHNLNNGKVGNFSIPHLTCISTLENVTVCS